MRPTLKTPIDSKDIVWSTDEIEISFIDGKSFKTSLVGGLLYSISNQTKIFKMFQVLAMILVVELGLIIWSLTLIWRTLHQ